jgi:hypothetical protein
LWQEDRLQEHATGRTQASTKLDFRAGEHCNSIIYTFDRAAGDVLCDSAGVSAGFPAHSVFKAQKYEGSFSHALKVWRVFTRHFQNPIQSLGIKSSRVLQTVLDVVSANFIAPISWNK